MRFDAIIQSRMGSKRLTNKIFFSLGNSTVLEFLLKNLKKIKAINKLLLLFQIMLIMNCLKLFQKKQCLFVY